MNKKLRPVVVPGAAPGSSKRPRYARPELVDLGAIARATGKSCSGGPSGTGGDQGACKTGNSPTGTCKGGNGR